MFPIDLHNINRPVYNDKLHPAGSALIERNRGEQNHLLIAVGPKSTLTSGSSTYQVSQLWANSEPPKLWKKKCRIDKKNIYKLSATDFCKRKTITSNRFL